MLSTLFLSSSRYNSSTKYSYIGRRSKVKLNNSSLRFHSPHVRSRILLVQNILNSAIEITLLITFFCVLSLYNLHNPN